MLISRFHEMNHCTSQISLLIPAMRSESSGGIAWDVISVAYVQVSPAYKC